MTDEEKKAIESVKDMFSDVTIKDIDEQSITIYGIAMLDVIKVLTIVEKQSKEIEELKNADLTTVYLNGVYDGEKKAKDKIKAKIEESELLIDNSQGCMSAEDLYKEYGKIEFGQSLLEKE